MSPLNYRKTALAVGLFLAGFHALWSILVATGAGQMFYDFILWAHMIHVPITIGPFELKAAVTLVAITFALGYLFGFGFAYVWNRLQRNA